MDRLSDFEFHDAEMKLRSYDGHTLVVTVKHLNIHKDTPDNDSESDIELEEAVMTISGVSILTYEPEDGAAILTGDNAKAQLLRDLKTKLCVLSLEEETPGQIVMDGIGDSPYFVARIGFDSVWIEWDAYRKKAWYELHRYYRREVCLAAPDGDHPVRVDITCHEEDVYNVRMGKMLKAPLVTIHLQYGGRDYLGLGRDEYWIESFADLQRQLPEGARLKCCLTCRHGNLCPTGNLMDEFFCTKDVSIAQKSDLYFYTEDPVQRRQRRRGCADLCEDYIPQNEHFYTYNDYLYFLTR